MPTKTELLTSIAAHLRATAADIDALAALPADTGTVTPPPVVVDPPPTPEPEVPTKPIWELVGLPTLTIPSEVVVPPGTQEIFIPVSVDKTDRQSFIAYIDRLVNVSGGGINVGTTAQFRANFEGVDKLYHWSPFDDGLHWIRIAPKNPSDCKAGKAFQVSIRVKGLGDKQKGKGITIRFVEGAETQTITKPFHRPLRKLDLSSAKRKNTFDPATVKWSANGRDANGKGILMSQLAHGRTQDGNSETGLYSDETVPGAVNPIGYDATEKALRLHTQGFPADKRLEHQSRLFAFQAVMLQGLQVDELCGTEGVWRMEAKIPIRKYSWPAFWLINRSPKTVGYYSQWPGEIDILEKFNFIYGADTPNTSSFAQHFGRLGSNVRLSSFGNDFDLHQYGLDDGPLDEAYHSWACHVRYDDKDTTKSEVTFFVDDIEVGCQVLFARHQDMKTKVEFYCLANVAVKTPNGYTGEQYNADPNTGDMLIKDLAYYPTGAKLV